MDNEWRVEPRNLSIYTGVGSTADSVKDIENRRIQTEKMTRPAPERPFKEVLAATIERVAKEQNPAEEDELPKKPSKGGGLLSAYQREILGMDDEFQDTEAKVLIKG